MEGCIKITRAVGDDGEWIETNRYFADGVEVTETQYRKLFPEQEGTPMLARAIHDAKPLRSDALAVHTSQIPAVLARNRRHGINVPYDRLGRPVFTDAGQRKKLMKLEKVRSQNSYYGY